MNILTEKPRTGAEKRAAKRANLDKPATMRVNETETTVRIVNISTTGLGLISTEHLTPKSLAEINLNLYFYNELTHLKLTAIVVHSTPVQEQFLIGLSLCDLNPFSFRVINQFVELHG
ncbi:PilZ domain-containing protein [Thiomicrospira microaerophila]|uniref:PilZ domain-containing protein n=1 Tax=Thiomicrospira microaerophila TaxID=406020 RepID=UPI00200C849D|nr:PilZ domain-containing protein [Thiomicrospira microaerophila]UQB42836.1 PilZ domain-containing protein [Thiomicrospira microaerophila]